MMPLEEASRTPQGLLTESLTESPRVEGPGPLGLAIRRNSVHADARDGHLLDEVGRRRCAWRVVLHLRLELGVAERSLEVLDRCPHGVVKEHRTSPDAPAPSSNAYSLVCLEERGVLGNQAS